MCVDITCSNRAVDAKRAQLNSDHITDSMRPLKKRVSASPARTRKTSEELETLERIDAPSNNTKLSLQELINSSSSTNMTSPASSSERCSNRSEELLFLTKRLLASERNIITNRSSNPAYNNSVHSQVMSAALKGLLSSSNRQTPHPGGISRWEQGVMDKYLSHSTHQEFHQQLLRDRHFREESRFHHQSLQTAGGVLPDRNHQNILDDYLSRNTMRQKHNQARRCALPCNASTYEKNMDIDDEKYNQLLWKMKFISPAFHGESKPSCRALSFMK